MPKITSAKFKIKGKVDDEVHVNSKKYGYHIRKAPTPGLKKDQPELKLQQGRNRLVNGLASELKKIFEYNYPMFTRPDLYHRMLKKFRQEIMDERCYLLLRLKKMEINESYPLTKLGESIITVTRSKNNIIIHMQVAKHPWPGQYKADCYQNDLLLLTWDKTKAPAFSTRIGTEWIFRKDVMPQVKFIFPKPAGTRHWMLILRQRLGVERELVEAFVGEGVQIFDTGSFDKKEQALMNEKFIEMNKRRKWTKGRPPEPKFERVRVEKGH